MSSTGASADAAAEVDVESAEAEELFTVDGFNLDRAVEMIEASDLDAIRRTVLIETLREAAGNPEQLETALTAAREALGL